MASLPETVWVALIGLIGIMTGHLLSLLRTRGEDAKRRRDRQRERYEQQIAELREQYRWEMDRCERENRHLTDRNDRLMAALSRLLPVTSTAIDKLSEPEDQEPGL